MTFAQFFEESVESHQAVQGGKETHARYEGVGEPA